MGQISKATNLGRTFQASCDAVLGDARCGVDLNDPVFKAIGTVVTISSDRKLTVSGLSGFTDGWFALGILQWLTGANAGRQAEVLGYTLIGADVNITLLEAPVRLIEPVDSFDIFAGCDKRFESCKAKFTNAINFRGFPHIPGQDTVIRYAAKGDANSGTVL